MLQHVPECHSFSGGIISLNTYLLNYAYGLGSPPLQGTGVDPVFWICDWGHYEHCVKVSVASLLPDPMATFLNSLTPRQNVVSVVSAATVGGVEQHLLCLCFHLPGGWWPWGHAHSALGSQFGRNVYARPLFISVGSSALLWSGCEGYTLNTKSSSHVAHRCFLSCVTLSSQPPLFSRFHPFWVMISFFAAE